MKNKNILIIETDSFEFWTIALAFEIENEKEFENIFKNIKQDKINEFYEVLKEEEKKRLLYNKKNNE